jgi:hypothetical protein
MENNSYWKNTWAAILTRYSDSLGDEWPGDRIPVAAEIYTRFQTGPGAHPASCILGTGEFPGVNRPGCGVDHLPLSSAEVKVREQPYFFSHSGLS